MNANPKFLAATALVDDAAIKPLPHSRKVHVGPLRVPMREVSQADTPTMFGGEKLRIGVHGVSYGGITRIRFKGLSHPPQFDSANAAGPLRKARL